MFPWIEVLVISTQKKVAWIPNERSSFTKSYDVDIKSTMYVKFNDIYIQDILASLWNDGNA